MTRSKVFIIALAYAAPLAVLAGTLQLSRVMDIPIHRFLRDPLKVTDSPFYTGAVSNLGIVCWSAAAGMALFVACVRNTSTAARRFFLCFGALTLLLLLDDLYQIHEHVFPTYVGPEQSLVAGYGILTALLLLRNRRFLLSREYGHLLAALACFAVSVVIDVFDPPGELGHLMEDGAKLLGIVAWTTFTAVASIAEVNTTRGAVTPVAPVRRSATSRGHRVSDVREASIVVDEGGGSVLTSAGARGRTA